MLHARNPFAAPISVRTERMLSTIGFVTVLGAWCAVYATVCPAERAPARHVASVEVRR